MLQGLPCPSRVWKPRLAREDVKRHPHGPKKPSLRAGAQESHSPRRLLLTLAPGGREGGVLKPSGCLSHSEVSPLGSLSVPFLRYSCGAWVSVVLGSHRTMGHVTFFWAC